MTKEAAYAVVVEECEWEGETWMTYFELDEDSAEPVTSELERICEASEHVDFWGVDRLSGEQCDVLANLPAGYMRPHVFLRPDLDKLRAERGGDALYKGGIRRLGDDLYETVTVEAGP